MIAIPIGPLRQRFVCVASPAYRERHGTPVHPPELAIGIRHASGRLSIWDFEKAGR